MEPISMNDPKVMAIDQPQAEHRTLSLLASQANLARRINQLKAAAKPQTLTPLRLTRASALPG